MTTIRDQYIQYSYAVVGVSQEATKYGHRIFRDLVENGFKVEGINPKGGELYDHTIYASLSDLPKIPDIVISVVPPNITEDIVKQCHELKVKRIWMQPGSESDQAIKLAKDLNLEVTANACFMTLNGIWK